MRKVVGCGFHESEVEVIDKECARLGMTTRSELLRRAWRIGLAELKNVTLPGSVAVDADVDEDKASRV